MRSSYAQTRAHDAGGAVIHRPALAAFMASWRACLIAAAACSGLTASQVFAQSSPALGAEIRNVASVSFIDRAGASVSIASNAVSATIAPAPSASSLMILRAGVAGGSATRAGPTQCQMAGAWTALPAPVLTGGVTIDPSQPVALSATATLHGGEAVFVRVLDADQNADPNVIEQAELRLATPAGDAETLRLSETGPNTGAFVGYIQTHAAGMTAGNCVLEVERNAQISTIYVDPADARDTSQASALVDPYGRVFDSRTGLPIDGARVRLLNAATGAPAQIVGDDGVSSYPAEVITGAQVTDAGGTVYALPAGVFRFPLVAPGDYRLEVDPPLGHAFPSMRTVPELSQLPTAPFRLSDGSFGTAFTVAAGPAVAVDVPLDPAATQLFMQKNTTTSVAAIGDFVQYQLSVENTSANAGIASVRTVDELPLGTRYQKGSTRVAGAAAADPEIAADGRTLTFITDALGPGQRVDIRYVVEITAGARGKQLVNSARAHGPDGLASNSAQVAIQLREELFRDRAIVMGRVVEGACAAEPRSLTGVPGVRVYLEDGRYSVTDEDGKYHFHDVAPGSHVVQIDTLTVPTTHEPQLCRERVRQAGRPYSQFVDVRGGALWRSDFVLARKPTPKGLVTLQLDSQLAQPSHLRHTARLVVDRLAIQSARLLFMLPDGAEYERGSARMGERRIDDPRIDSNVLTFTLGDVHASTTAMLTFQTRVPNEASGALGFKAAAVFDTPSQQGQRSGVVENVVLRGEMLHESASYRVAPHFDVPDTNIRAADRAQLDRIIEEWRGVSHLQLTAIGHSDQILLAPRKQAAYPDNYALSTARARIVADYLAKELKIDPARVSVESRGADEVITNARDAQSLARNGRVDVHIEGLRVVAAGNLMLQTASARSEPVETTGVLTVATDSGSVANTHRAPVTEQVSIDIDRLSPGVAWLLPREQDVPAIPSIKVAIQHLPDQQVELSINGTVVGPLNFDGVTSNQARTLSLSRWRGVDLQEGENELVAVVRDADGQELERMVRNVHYAGGAVRAEVVREASTLVADGRTRPMIALRMIDASGKTARPGTLGAFRVELPYRSWWEVETLHDNKLVASGAREPTFTVDADGLARIELEPTTQAGTAILRLRFNERRQQEIRVWLDPQAREWILVGLAEGTAAHRTISDNMQSAAAAGLEEGYARDGRVAFFAKGAIKGEYLLTAAYDSAREHEMEKDHLLDVVEPDRFYTLYGDATEQRFEAATSRKLFVKLERRQFAALFGDFETGLTVTELSRYSRTFTGLKSDYAGERFGYTAFAAQSEQGYVKDELQGDGTSGLYRLSRRPLIVNSDRIRLEVRDRFRSERIVESRPLTRHLDYSIDYLNGTLFFKQPVPSRDSSFNPVYIVAEYEVLNGGAEQLTAGGRASVKFGGERLEVGTSYLHEGAASGATRIAGTDMRWRMGDATELRAELARSGSEDSARADRANAYLTELTHITENLDARVYVREQETGFGAGQQRTSETGTRKLGLDGRYRVADQLWVEAETYRQQMLDTHAQRELVSAELRYEADDYSLGSGARHVADSGLATGDAQSQHAFVNGSVDLFGDRVTLRASQDFAVGGSSSSVDFPARSILGVDYHWRPDTDFFAEYERADGEQLEADTTRVGVRTAPWQRAQVQTSLGQQATEYGPRVFANFGLTQSWQPSERWGFDFGVDQSKTMRGSAVAPLNPNVPLASGSLAGDFLATFVGAMYRSDLWAFTSRLEHRDSREEDRRIVSAGFYREPRAGHAFSLATQWFDSVFADGANASAGQVQLGWAFRPVDSSWIVLDRLDVKHDRRRDSLGEFESMRVINNLNSNWQLDVHTQLGLQLGARYVRSTFDGGRYSGLSTLYGVDVRRDLTSRFDAGLHGSMLTSVDAKVSDHSVGVDIGMSLGTNVWISMGYNFVGFRDQDFEASRYIAQGPFIKFRIKADQDTFKDLPMDALRASSSLP